jgi:hypothetical protein
MEVRKAHAADTWKMRLTLCLGVLKGLLCGLFGFRGPESMFSRNASPLGWTQTDPFFLFLPPRILPKSRPPSSKPPKHDLCAAGPEGWSHTAGAGKAKQSKAKQKRAPATAVLDSAIGVGFEIVTTAFGGRDCNCLHSTS